MKKANPLLTIFTFILLTITVNSMTIAQSIVLFETTAGNFKIWLYDETPEHKNNFLKLVNEGFYNDILFHRVISGFMIQTGDPNSKNAEPGQVLGNGGPGYTLPAEFLPQYFHKKGAVAAARLGDQMNPEKKSSGSQFYIVQGQAFTLGALQSFVDAGRHDPFTEDELKVYTSVGGTPHLDNEYTVFGEVIEGLDIIDAIAAAPTDSKNRPISDIKIIKATILSN
jgi:peptidyl-prolyl cis-trans isomerase B (cyclophilin B)